MMQTRTSTSRATTATASLPLLILVAVFTFSHIITQHTADGYVVSGSIEPQSPDTHIFFVGKFCYAPGQGHFSGDFTAPVGMQLMIFDDQSFSWPNVIANQDNCAQQITGTKETFTSSLDEDVFNINVEEGYTRWWYAAFVSCTQVISVQSYTINFINQSQNQLSVNQQGLPSVYAVYFTFLAACLLVIAVAPPLRRYIKHPMSAMLLVAMSVECLSRMFLLAYYWNIYHTGYTAVSVLGLGEWLDQASQAVLLALSLLVCFGWNFTALTNLSKVVLIGAVFAYAFMGLMLVIWGTSVHDTYWYVDTLLATPLGAVLTTVRLILLATCIAAAHMSMKNEKRVERALWIRRFVLATSIWQALYIFFSYITFGLESYNQALFIWAATSTINTLYFGALLVAMQPSIIGDLFGSPFGSAPPQNRSVAEEFLDDSRSGM